MYCAINAKFGSKFNLFKGFASARIIFLCFFALATPGIFYVRFERIVCSRILRSQLGQLDLHLLTSKRVTTNYSLLQLHRSAWMAEAAAQPLARLLHGTRGGLQRSESLRAATQSRKRL